MNMKGPKGDTGNTGSQGIQGIQGVPGEKWFSGTGAPAGATGIIGDWYLDTVNGEVYEKTGASSWVSRGNIRGPTGAQGIQGPQGTTGAQGTKARKVSKAFPVLPGSCGGREPSPGRQIRGRSAT